MCVALPSRGLRRATQSAANPFDEPRQALTDHLHIVASAPGVHDALVALLKRAVQVA
jgi:hypothetical protein